MFLNSCFITEEKIHKKLEGSPSPEAELSPAAKDQVEMYVSAHSASQGCLLKADWTLRPGLQASCVVSCLV